MLRELADLLHCPEFQVDQILLEVHMHVSDHAHDSAHPEHFDQETVVKWTKLFTALRNDGFRVYDIRAKG